MSERPAAALGRERAVLRFALPDALALFERAVLLRLPADRELADREPVPPLRLPALDERLRLLALLLRLDFEPPELVAIFLLLD